MVLGKAVGTLWVTRNRPVDPLIMAVADELNVEG